LKNLSLLLLVYFNFNYQLIETVAGFYKPNKEPPKRPFKLYKERSKSCIFNEERPRLKIFETMKEKLYRDTIFRKLQNDSLIEAIANEKPVDLDSKLTKKFQIKQLADIVESLTASVYIKAGLHGAQMFLKFLNVLDTKQNYKQQYESLIDDLEKFETEDYKSKMRDVEKFLGYEFGLKNVS